MKKDLVEIAIVLDESGSMNEIKKDTIGGFNSFLDVNKSLPGEVNFTLVKFNTFYSVVHNGIPIKDVPNLDDRSYFPGGMTALFDAVGRTIDEIGARLSNTNEEDRPEKVMVVIITDGEENSSKEYSMGVIKDKIKLQTETYKWEFIFLGSDLNSWSNGDSLGIVGNIGFDKNKIGKTMLSTALYSAKTRGYGGDPTLNDYNLSEEEIKSQIDNLMK